MRFRFERLVETNKLKVGGAQQDEPFVICTICNSRSLTSGIYIFLSVPILVFILLYHIIMASRVGLSLAVK